MANGYELHPHQRPDSMGGAHPMLVIGIFIFIIPFFKDIVNIGLPGWLYTGITIFGVLLMVVGGILSIFTAGRQ